MLATHTQLPYGLGVGSVPSKLRAGLRWDLNLSLNKFSGNSDTNQPLKLWNMGMFPPT